MLKSPFFYLLIAVFYSFHFGFAADKPYITVGEAKTKRTILAFPEIKQTASSSLLSSSSKTIYETVSADLNFMDLFKFMNPSGFIEDKNAGIVSGSFKMSDWTSIGVEFLIKSSVSLSGNSIALEGYLYDTFGGKQVLSKKYIGKKSDIKVMAHTFGNDIVHALTGLPGIFLTKITMSCDKNVRM